MWDGRDGKVVRGNGSEMRKIILYFTFSVEDVGILHEKNSSFEKQIKDCKKGRGLIQASL